MSQRGEKLRRTSVVLVDSTHVETHRVDLDQCWARWRAIQGEEGRLHTLGELAAAASVSMETIGRFMHGRGRVSLRSGRRILTALQLEFDLVARPIEPALHTAC
jgi:hypothetical protein